MINVLLMDGGNALGDALIDSLKDYRIIVSSVDFNSSAILRAGKKYILSKDWKRYDKKIEEIINKEKVDIIIPCHDISLLHLLEVSYEVPTLFDREMVKIALDKYKTYEWLKSKSLLYPKTWNEPSKVEGFPAIIKPTTGTGSKGIFIVKNEKELEVIFDFCVQKGFNPIIQECLKGEEYSNMAYVSKDGEVLSTTVSSVRKRNGVSHRIIVLKDGSINGEVMKIAEKLKVSGPINMQGIETEDGFTVFEFNARFSVTESCRTSAGVNGPDLLIENWLFGTKKYPKVKETVTAFLSYSYYYVPERRWKLFRK